MSNNLDVITLIEMISTAMKCKKQMAIVYRDKENNLTRRFVEPIEWKRNGNGIGVLTKCHEREGCYRHFKLDNIERILISDYDYEYAVK